MEVQSNVKKQLNFEAHIANICKKAARQINVLLRLSNVLNQETKKTKFISRLFIPVLIIALWYGISVQKLVQIN